MCEQARGHGAARLQAVCSAAWEPPPAPAQPGSCPHLSRTRHFSQCITLTQVKLKGWVFGYSKANTNHMNMQTHGSRLVLLLGIFQTTAVATKHRGVWG